MKELNETIQIIPSLVESLYSLSIYGWLTLAVIFGWLTLNKNLPLLLETLKQRAKGKIDQFDAYISTPDLSDESTMKVIKDLRDAHYFKMATGIYAERRPRNALIKLHETTCHTISWRYICRAYPHLKIAPDETVTVKQLDIHEKFSYWYNQAIGYTFLLLSAALFSIIIFSEMQTPTSFFLGVGGGLLCVLFAMNVFSRNWPIQAARKIAEELENQRNTGGSDA